MGNIIYLILSWGAALLFVLIGIYARQRKKPMWFWPGIEVPESKVRDVKAYNRANAKMWCVFSIPFWVSGVVEFFLPLFSVVMLVLASTLGLALIVWYYHKIEEKYIVK